MKEDISKLLVGNVLPVPITMEVYVVNVIKLNVFNVKTTQPSNYLPAPLKTVLTSGMLSLAPINVRNVLKTVMCVRMDQLVNNAEIPLTKELMESVIRVEGPVFCANLKLNASYVKMSDGLLLTVILVVEAI